MARIVIIVGHALPGTYCGALAEAYMRGAESAGHQVSLFNTASMTFDPILRGGYRSLQALEPDLAAARTAIQAADHMVIIFPLWLGTLPAIFKGFLERVIQPDIFEPAKTGKFATPWKGKSARIVMTMGMPGFIYRWYFGAHALKMLKRNILGFLGVGPIRSTIHGSIEGVSGEKRAQWLADMEALGRAAG
ncbi:MAG: NAD(P)H-dependent oxidoreductase [Hyphomicrobium sp.]|uniref:NAD(P)H-dependent oxidoreductase n=1 Tax=Hyphomicrobium sp. CS1BSMeth3 TaxID=1892844 RepID=UPI000930941A|nr:NAD(P)H-dependent oxidoreductase [Hyphomicrobium sp. CS1BSMeth3]MBN9259555.1 NAD(P)H-dependent oxidoreductase [Hyphomicrobium sp.]MBN9264520.1 NAD(P)H-dependent oxidoreductase [Hyphomicrobium sp.]MBN9280401.1 NAD(P)H-dependent oxidoreductase [Hyphomicrobium sp.]